MIIVSGRIHVARGRHEAFLAASREAAIKARSTPGCRDFVVAADQIEPDRVNVYEEWESEGELMAFRGGGPAQELTLDIVAAVVSQHQIASSHPS